MDNLEMKVTINYPALLDELQAINKAAVMLADITTALCKSIAENGALEIE